MVGEDGLPLKTWPERRADLGQQAPGREDLEKRLMKMEQQRGKKAGKRHLNVIGKERSD